MTALTAGPRPPTPRATGSETAGTATLLRLALRRDRVLIPAVAVGLAILVVASAQATIALYRGADSARLGRDVAGVVGNPAFLAMYGPLPTPPNLDSFSIFKTIMMGGVFLAIAVVAVVRRHTRTEEEEGRFELVGAGVVGRRAPLVAAVVAALILTAATCLLCAAGMLALGMDPTGTVLFALDWFGLGLVMSAVSAVAAQLTSTARGCTTIALSVLGMSFALRAAGDAVDGAGALVWVSPLGWMLEAQPYGANRFWVLLIPVAVSIALFALALRLLERRDLGAGLVAERPGPDRAGRWLGSTLGLAWRLQRGSLLVWTVALALVGVLIGSLAASVQSMLNDPTTRDMLRQLSGGDTVDPIELFLSAEFAFISLAIAGFGIAATLRLRGEEREIHAEPVLATPTTRWVFLGSHLVIALAGSTWLMAVVGTVVGVIRGVATGDLAGQLGTMVPAALGPLPAVWVCVGLTVLIYGLVPQWTSTAWLLLVLFLVVGEFGSLLGLPDWIREISPFAHLPSLPGGVLTAAPLVVLAVCAVALLGSGSVGFRRRDVG
jgi:ABC-2 type transport system permease protein